jgi:hypothetical protein
MSIRTLVPSAFVLALLVACVPPPHDGPVDWDVRGNYALTYDDRLVLKLNIGGAIREATADGWGDVVDFGTHEGEPLVLDLAEHCARPEVQCPSELLWSHVAVDQQDVQHAWDGHFIRVIDATDPEPPPGVHAASRGGFVDHRQKGVFLVGLDSQAAGNEHCAALAISLAGGRFARVGEAWVTETIHRDQTGARCEPDDDEDDLEDETNGNGNGEAEDEEEENGNGEDGGDEAEDGDDETEENGAADETEENGAADEDEETRRCDPVEVERLTWTPGAAIAGIEDGKVVVGWAGGCAFGPILIGATLTVETGFTGVRTGAFEPPPFVSPPENEETWEDLAEAIEDDLDDDEDTSGDH